MNFSEQSISNPHGVTVFGSAVVRVEPDFATLDFCVAGEDDKASSALHDTYTQATAVADAFRAHGLAEAEYRASRPKIQEFAGESTFSRFRATIDFNVTIRDLDMIEGLLMSAVDNGGRNVRLVYRTTRIREARAEAQQTAVLAAFRKADTIGEAGGIRLGRILHIEDIDPDRLERQGDNLAEIDYFDTTGAYDPGAVVIRAAVRVSFSIKGTGTPEVTGTYNTIG